METSVMHQDVSRNVPIGLDESENPLESVPSYSLLPELKSDEEIENVLHKISKLLTSSSPTRTADINDSRSISEILREAEELVKDSSGYFEALSAGGVGISGVGGAGSEASDITDCSQELERDSPLCADPATHDEVETPPATDIVVEITTEKAVNISFLPITKPEAALTPPSLRTPGGSPRKRPPSSLALHTTTPQEIPPPQLESSDEIPQAPENWSEPTEVKIEVEVISQSPPRSRSRISSIGEAAPGRQASTPKRSTPASIRSTPCHSPIHSRPPGTTMPSEPSDQPEWHSSWNKENNPAEDFEDIDDCYPTTPLDQTQGEITNLEEIQKGCEERIALLQEFDKMKKGYEEKIYQLQEEMSVFQKKALAAQEAAEAAARVCELEQQLVQRDSLLAASRDENTTVRAEAAKARYEDKKRVLWKIISERRKWIIPRRLAARFVDKSWSEAERRLGEKIRRLEGDLRRANTLNTTEALELREQLADAREQITSLEEENHLLKIEKRELEARLAEAEAESRRNTTEVVRAKEAVTAAEEALAAAKANERERADERARDSEIATAALRARLSNVTAQLTAKHGEVSKLNTELGRVRGELERARLGSVLGSSGSQPASAQVRQLEAALERQHAATSAASQQAYDLSRRNADLQRQVKELEAIVKRRVRGSSGAPWAMDNGNPRSPNGNGQPANGNPGEPTADINSPKVDSLEHRNRQLEELLETKEKLLLDYTRKLNDLQSKTSGTPAARSASALSLANRKQIPGSARNAQNNQPSQDAHLLATIRGLKADLASKDKQVARLQKELEDYKKKKPVTPIGKQPRPQSKNLN